MDNFNNILRPEQYTKLQQEYSKILTPPLDDCINLLNNIISSLETQGFGMPLRLQNQTLNTLNHARQILEISHQSKPLQKIKISNSPLELIYQLSNLSIKLTSYNYFKSPYQILNFKTNNLIMDCILNILRYFIKK